MRFWNLDALADDLAHRRVGERQKCAYLLVSFFIGWLWSLLSLFREGSWVASSNWLLQAFPALLCAVYAAGTWVAFKIHQRGPGHDFLGAYFCLSVPAAVRATVVGAGLCGVATIALAATMWKSEAGDYYAGILLDLMGHVLAVSMHALYFYFLWTAMRRASPRAAAADAA